MPPSNSHQRRRWRGLAGFTGALGLLSAILILSGCRPNAAPTAAVTQARLAVVATSVVQVVTTTPIPSPTPTKLPTLAFDTAQVQGRWQMDLDYHLYGLPYFSDIRYNGSLEVTVSQLGKVSGSGVLYPILKQAPCQAFERDGAGVEFTLTGELQPDRRTSRGVVGVLQIVPANPAVQQNLVLACADRTRFQTVALLWPALAAADQLNLRLTFAPNTVITSLRGLTGPTQGSLPAVLTSEIRLNR